MLELFLASGKKKVSKDLLMHFDGPRLSTYFKDEGGRTVTHFGTAAITTVQSKFGGSSGYFDADGLILSEPILLENDYTVECWAFIYAYPSTRGAIAGSSKQGTVHPLMINATGRLGYWMYNDPNGSTWAPSGGMTLNSWHHIAATRQGSIYRLFLNGAMVLERVAGIKPIIEVDRLMRYNQDTNTDGFKGYVDELRILSDRAVYTAAFTPPDSPFTL